MRNTYFLHALILAAGMGTRLKPLTDTMPKCLTEVHGRTILENALHCLEKNGIQETTLVIGYLGNKVQKVIGNDYGRMKIRYVYNEQYALTNTAYSLFLGLKDLPPDTSLLILEGDVYFENRLLSEFLHDKNLTSTVIQKFNPDLDGSFVELEGKAVIDWVHKNVRPQGFTLEDKYKTVNIHKLHASFVKKWLLPVIKEHIKMDGRKKPLEYIFQDIVKNRGGIMQAFETRNLKWFEIDDLKDLQVAERIFSEE